MARKPNPVGFRLTKDCLLPGIMFCLLVRWCVAAYPYSGYQKPPMYGDYEAQRHWQEITLQTPVRTWYQNSSQNDLEYWGLDYPPLTAYHSKLMGVVAEWLEPESVILYSSRGYESETHKQFMRWTVFLCDVYFFVTAALCLSIDIERIKSKDDKNVFKRTDIGTILLLLYPGIILIDHGHFQYNCVSLGLFMWATAFIVAIENDAISTLIFVCALNYKQMELYHALPFFFYLLRNCYNYCPPNTNRLINFINRLNRLAVGVTCMFIIIWVPYIRSWPLIVQVINRLFPLTRGVFEDKVSNVWCVVNIFIKLKERYSNEMMAKMCLIATATAALPSCLDLFFRINKKKFILSLINVSLAFFLFSFQVHEKSILLCAIPVALHMPEDPFMCFWFLLVSNFSMLPLLIKDGLIIPFIATNCIYICFFSICIKLVHTNSGIFSIFNANLVYGAMQPNKSNTSNLNNLLSTNFILSFLGMCMMTYGALFIKPPPKLPDLFPLLISVYSCCHFFLFFLYFYGQQFKIPKVIPSRMKHKMY